MAGNHIHASIPNGGPDHAAFRRLHRVGGLMNKMATLPPTNAEELHERTKDH